MAAHEAPLSWDSPGKNTGVGCHFLLQYMKVKSESEDAQLYPTLSDLFRNAGNNENSVTGKLSVRNLACAYSITSNSSRPHGLYVARQSALSIEFSREEILKWVVIFHPSGDLPHPGI